MVAPFPSLALRERVLLWLDHVERTGGGGPSVASTQSGITAATGLSRGHVSRTLAPLLRQGLIVASRDRVAGFSRTLLSYRLTSRGQAQLQELAGSLAGVPIQVRRLGTGPTTIDFSQAIQSLPRSATLWAALLQLEQEGVLNLDAPQAAPPPRARFLREMTEAPATAIFIGRERELERMRVWLQGKAPLLLLEAPGGLGKSSLVAHALRAADPRSHVLWVRILEGIDAGGVLRRLNQFLGLLGRPSPASASGRTEDTLLQLSTRVRGFPIILVVDDAQKGPRTKDALQLLVRVAHVEPTFRLILVGRDLAFMGDLAAETERQKVGPLGPAESQQLLEALGVTADHRGRMARVARGNPLFLTLLGRSPDAANGGTSLPDFLTRSLHASLPPAHRDLLHVACALRVPAPAAMFQQLGVGSPAALEDLVQSSILVRTSTGAYEMHDIVRDAFYQRLEFPERSRIHQRLSDVYRPSDQDWSGAMEFLHHLVQAGRREEAARWVFRNRTRLMERAHELFEGPRRSALPIVTAPVRPPGNG